MNLKKTYDFMNNSVIVKSKYQEFIIFNVLSNINSKIVKIL